jgi:hypothetical protein
LRNRDARSAGGFEVHGDLVFFESGGQELRDSVVGAKPDLHVGM